MNPLTVIIPCKNEAHNIEQVLQSVSWADEIMVVDSFSTDKTVEFAKKYTDFILQHECIDSMTQQYVDSAQKNWAIPQANNEWILLVDADERVTAELKQEILEVLNNNPQEVAFWIKLENYFMGKKIKYSGWQHDAVIRLFKRDHCKYEQKYVHAEIVANGKIGYLKSKLLHHTYKGLKHYLEKWDRYTSLSAKDYHA
ncbi:MAG: glycosyltransferase family 2 protein, partial [Bacteroidetes bacterium]|nr:glycosyltransferase family 2 protein [Bacteroidota bacterium]